MSIKKKITEIIFREDLYPRFNPNQQTIKKYSEAVEYLPPIKINQNNILIDGLHRLKAHELAGIENIKVKILEIESEKELKKLAYKFNSNHGLQLSNDEKREYANEMISEMTSKELVKILSVSESTINGWTKDRRKSILEQRNREMIEEYLRAWNTQDDVAKKFKVTQGYIPKIKNKIITKTRFGFSNNFIPFLYNSWNVKKGNKTKHFGSFPKIYMDNLLFYHTKMFDVVYDPFCGDGTMIDSCKEMYRRYYCADMKIMPGREKDMKVRKIQDGYPDDLQKPNLVFLDSPYWKQSKGKYSNSPDDLGNMSLGDFYITLNEFINEIIKRKIEKIAIVIQPTQYSNNFIFEDHIFKFNEMLKIKYKIEMRYILPYSPNRYNAQMMKEAKKVSKCLVLNRDLVIWRLNG